MKWIWRTLVVLAVIAVLVIGGLIAISPPKPVPAEPVRIDAGLVAGLREGDVTVYRGIPYAAPPAGNLRWRTPQAVAGWEGVRQATAFGPACMQAPADVGPLAVGSRSEDCLFLNVWTPATDAAAKLPVMVWLHGGGLSSGAGSSPLYDGSKLASHGVLVVTLNYRLLAFATLAHPALTAESGIGASGNYHLQDIIAALQWVSRNAAAFGGDAANVTLFGHSAGAYHASLLMVSPAAKGLFHRVIAESGGAFSPSGPDAGFPKLAQAEQVGVAWAAKFGADTLEALRAVPAETIVQIDTAATSAGGVSGVNRMSVDGFVVPEDVHTMFAAGEQHSVDVLVGYTAQEGATMVGTPVDATSYARETRTRYGEFGERFLAQYPARTNAEVVGAVANRATEDVAWRALTWAQLHARARHRVFLYEFSRVPPFAPYKQLNAAGHGAELGYVFGSIPSALYYVLQAPWNGYRDVRLADHIQRYWTNFAKTGDPNGGGLPAWPQFTSAKEQLLELGDDIGSRAPGRAKEHALMDAYYGAM